MTEFFIGAGGWGYFQVPGLNPLEAYASAFNFVEINATFYEVPSLHLAKSWRRRVTQDFEFSVRCHRDVTHKYRLEPAEPAFKTFMAVVNTCRVLNSRFLVLETPSTLVLSEKKIKSVKDFFESVDLKGIRLVWEVRRNKGAPLPSAVLGVMQDYNIINCNDLSRENPPEGDTVYTRVFGKGKHNVYQFTDKEITEIDKKIVNTNSETAVVSFHNVRMYKDAARYTIYKKTKRFPSATGVEGEPSLRKVLTEDAQFPLTKQELVNDQGWKVIDLTGNRRVHASKLLTKLPETQFKNIEEVLKSLKLSEPSEQKEAN